MDGDGGLWENDFDGGDYKMALMDRCFVATQGDDVRVKALVGCFNNQTSFLQLVEQTIS